MTRMSEPRPDHFGWLMLGASLGLIALAVALMAVLFPSEAPRLPPDRIELLALSADGARRIVVLRRDNGLGFGLGDEFGVVRVEENRDGGEGADAIVFDRVDLERVRMPIEWRDADHAVVRFIASAEVQPTTVTAHGVTVTIEKDAPP